MRAMLHQRFVWHIEELDAADLERFGGKGAGLARMARIGIPVPPAFVVGTDAFRAYRAGGELPRSLSDEVDAALARLEEATGKRFAGEGAPLLLSVRSGASVSMPGMMDTILNLGLDARSAHVFAQQMNSVDFALDTWLRFWRMFSDIVLALDSDAIVSEVAAAKARASDEGTPAAFAALESAIADALASRGVEVELAPRRQLDLAMAAVFASWDSRRAKAYRQHHGIRDDLGTAVTVQAMVFGNRDRDSGSGVAFTRNPNTGAKGLYGEYVIGRQGEDLVSGTSTPIELSEPGGLDEELRSALLAHGERLEQLYRNAVDIEFTVESSRLYFLQVRAAKRTAEASIRVAVELADEGLIERTEALRMVSEEQVGRMLRRTFEPGAVAQARLLASGIGSSPGHACGVAVLDADRAAERAAEGEPVILLRPTTSPQDIRGMLSAEGIVTARGGALSHAAVVSRALDKPCIVGCEAIDVDLDARTFSVDGAVYPEGISLSIDGAAGTIYEGMLPTQVASADRNILDRLLSWAGDASQARIFVAARNRAEVFDQRSYAAAGFAVVGLTDLLISAGTIDELIAAIGTISRGEQTAALEERITDLVFRATHRFLAEARDVAVDLRLPSLTSDRARRMMDTWASLAPRLLLPLGAKAYYVPILRGIARAAHAAEHRNVCALIGGITDPAEVRAFGREAEVVGGLRVGAVLRNAASLHHAAAMLEDGAALWIDLHEIVRTTHGFPNELLAAEGLFDEYAAEGYLTSNPRTTLEPFLVEMLGSAIARGPAHVGVDFGAVPNLALAAALYQLGCRKFSVPISHYERMRLVLGQTAVGVGT